MNVEGKWYSESEVISYIQKLKKMVNSNKTKSARWKQISPAKIYECSNCGQNVMTGDICTYRYCHGCGYKMEAPNENK